jgi:twitching motility protein PilI
MAEGQVLGILQEIKAATYQNAAQLPLNESVQPEWQGLGYQVGGLRLVTSMGEISEVLQVPRIAALPGVKSWVLGIANVRGRLVPVIDLHEYLGIPATLPVTHWRVLVVEGDTLVAGLLVEQSLGIQHFGSESSEETTADIAEELEPHIRGAFRHGGRVYYETSLRSILREDKFFDVIERTT